MRERRHARFEIERLHVAIVKAVVGVAAQRVLAAQTRHQVEGHLPPGRRVRKDLPSVRREDPLAEKERNDQRYLELVPTEAVRALVSIGVGCDGTAEYATPRRVTGVIAPVHRHVEVAVEK